MTTGKRIFVLRGAVAALALICCTTLSGCWPEHKSVADPTPAPLSCAANADGQLTFVVGARANSPVPQLPPQVQQLLSTAASDGQAIEAVDIDGVPAFQFKMAFDSTAQGQMRARDLGDFVDEVQQSIAIVRPKKPEADVLAALSLAAQITPSGGTIVLLDSGLPTAGSIDFRDPDMFGADPGEVAAFLRSQGLLPDFTGKSVVLVNVGNTADPQPVLAQNIRTQLVDLWTDVARQGGAACVDSLQMGFASTSVSTDVAVSVVRPPAPPEFSSCGTTVLGDDGSVGFIVGTSTFRDPQAARTALTRLADLLAGGNQLATLTGSTSSEGSASVNQTLSVQRAQAVANVLEDLGVAASRITVIGDGSDAPGDIPDMTAQGVLIPSAAEHNRSVTVTLRCAG